MSALTDENSIVLCPASVQHCRQSEASILPLDDGRSFLGYTDYYGGGQLDTGTAKLLHNLMSLSGEPEAGTE